jgi:dihydroorotate dehydrogenase electron transfer subunit
MKSKGIFWAEVLKNEPLTEGIYDLHIKASVPDVAGVHTVRPPKAKAGQFLSIYTGSAAMILPRPLSICETDKAGEVFRVIYQTAGAGTLEIAKAKIGDKLQVLGPLGNSYPINQNHKNFVLVGGGIGVPPLLELAKTIRFDMPQAFITAYLGFRNKGQIILAGDLTGFTDEVFLCTDDGSMGFKGNVVQRLSKNTKNNLADVIYGCGPGAMLKSLADYAADNKITCFVSLEERMACTIGACLACVVKVHEGDKWGYKKVCSDGPVFNATEVAWDE